MSSLGSVEHLSRLATCSGGAVVQNFTNLVRLVRQLRAPRPGLGEEPLGRIGQGLLHLAVSETAATD